MGEKDIQNVKRTTINLVVHNKKAHLAHLYNEGKRATDVIKEAEYKGLR